MAKIKNPLLFSKHFKVAKAKLNSSGLIDPFLNVDTQLFIDPVLLEKSSNKVIRKIAHKNFRDYFTKIVRLLQISKSEGDAAWKGAKKLLNLDEPALNGLGYGGSSRSGSSRSEDIRKVVLRTCKEIIDLGSSDPEMICLMGFFEEGVGADTISDFTTQVIVNDLASITYDFCKSQGIPTSASSFGSELPHYNDGPILLVPLDIVRDLPIANDWSDIESAALQNEEIRDKVNALLGSIAHPVVADRKAALKSAALESTEAFEHFLSSVKENADNYDPNQDSLGYYKLRDLLLQDLSALKSSSTFNMNQGPERIRSLVLETIEQFRHHVEHGNLWEELWIGDTPKKERAAQLMYFAIADCFCRANNVDISPEANMGGGPIDFKFSGGYSARVLVEMKRSSGTVRHGYEKQLEIYKDASRTNYGIFVVMDFGDLGRKIKQIEAIRTKRINAGEQASDIIVIDARKKTSASKRR